MTGTVRRHKFTPHELDLLLDLSTCGVRKSARANLLARYLSYLKAVQRTQGDAAPPRLSLFLQSTGRKPPAMRRATGSTKKAAAGLSSK